MLDRLESISRLLCIGLAALLLLQLVNAVLHGDPLGRATIPDLPTLPAAASAAAPETPPGAATATAAKTNPAPVVGTDASVKTNSEPAAKTNALVKTNSAPAAKTAASANTNSAPVAKTAASANTNSAAVAKTAGPANTNSAPVARGGRPRPGMPRFMPGMKADLPPAVQARVDRIVESEILGPFIRPMPMALLGIAGEDAFLRAPDGQTGMVKEGADLGSIKLLRIGTNRVLVEEKGEKRELTLFAGMGGESLLPPETNSNSNSNLNTNAPLKKKETN